MTGNLTWADLFKRGSCFDLDIHRWYGLVSMKPEDLGLDGENFEVREALTFGSERLVSKDSLDAIAKLGNLARMTVYAAGIPFPLVAGSRFVPADHREELEGQLLKIKADWDRAVMRFCANYEKHVNEMRPVLREAIRHAAKTPAAAERAIARIEGEVPTVENVRMRFEMTWRSIRIDVPIDGTETAAKEVSHNVQGALGDMVVALRKELSDRLAEINALVEKGGRITEKTYNATLKLCERLKQVNFLGDSALDAAIEAIKTCIEAARADKDNAAPSLQKGMEAAKKELAVSVEEAVARAAEKIRGGSLGKRKFT